MDDYPAPMRLVYLLRSLKNNSLYIGSTDNLMRRIREHNAGLSKSTKRYVPWKCVYFEGYAAEKDAYEREAQLKVGGNAMGQLKRRLRHTLIDP
jgi:putative endonuclease